MPSARSRIARPTGSHARTAVQAENPKISRIFRRAGQGLRRQGAPLQWLRDAHPRGEREVDCLCTRQLPIIDAGPLMAAAWRPPATGAGSGLSGRRRGRTVASLSWRFDLILRKARIAGGSDETVDIGIANGRIAAIAPNLTGDAREEQLDGRLVVPGLCRDAYPSRQVLHSRTLPSEHGTLDGGDPRGGRRQAGLHRGRRLRARAAGHSRRRISHGTTHMRTHVEVDPRVGLRGFNAIRRLKQTTPGRSTSRSASSRRKGY